MFRRFDWSAVTDASKNRSAYIFRVKPTMNRPLLPASVDIAQHRTGLDSSVAPLWQLQKLHTMFMHLAILIVAENPYIRAQKWLIHELNDWQSSIIGPGGGTVLRNVMAKL